VPRPNPKSKKGSPIFFGHSHILSEKAQNKLIELLGYDSEKDKKNNNQKLTIMEVQYWLGFYSGGLEALDKAPRPSDYREMFRRLGKPAAILLNDLIELNDFYREQFTIEDSPVELADIEISLAVIIDVSAAVIKKYENKSSKGASKNDALMEVILNLRRTFRKYYKGTKGQRKKKGGFTFKTEDEKKEIRFVETALLDAKIILKNNSYKIVERHFQDLRCIPE